MNKNSINISGLRFKNLTAIEFSHHNKVEYWKFRCELCGNDTIKRKPDVKKGCVDNCGCRGINKGTTNGQWSGYEGINGRTFSYYKKAAKKRGKNFDVTIEYLWDVYNKQDRKCPYTNINLVISPKNSEFRTPENASLDRIDSSKGYIVGNVQWVYKFVNVMKHELSHNEFIEICNLISRHCPFTPAYTKGNTELKEYLK